MHYAAIKSSLVMQCSGIIQMIIIDLYPCFDFTLSGPPVCYANVGERRG